jgi:hypothetical protein
MQLLRRYPAIRDGEVVYVLREYLTLEERRENSERLRKEAAAKAAHADAIQAETLQLHKTSSLTRTPFQSIQ